MEMLKLVVAKGAADALIEMEDGGLLGAITAGVSYHGPFANMVEAERMLGFTADAIRRLGALTVATPEDALSWYDDFVGIVMHPADAVAARQVMDHAGVVHHYAEVLAGEAMQDGPVMLSWPAVQGDGTGAASSVVIHEFVHKMDMQAGGAHGAPPLPRGFMGARTAREAAAIWARTWAPAYQHFREQLIRAERFGEPLPWLDAYAASAPAEFFAVACEAHFVEPARFAQEFPALAASLREFFKQKEPKARSQ